MGSVRKVRGPTPEAMAVPAPVPKPGYAGPPLWRSRKELGLPPEGEPGAPAPRRPGMALSAEQKRLLGLAGRAEKKP